MARQSLVNVVVKGVFWSAQQKGRKKEVKRGLAIGKASLCLWVRSDHECDHIDHSIPPSEKGISGEVFFIKIVVLLIKLTYDRL